MSKVKAMLASYIIKEHFGELIEKVSSYLLQNGNKSLKDIVTAISMSREEVKKSMSILIHHNLVSFSKNKNEQTEYHAHLDLILRRKRYQKYVYCAKLKLGDVAELIVETLLLNGCDSLSRISKRVADRLEVDEGDENMVDEGLVIQKCKELILGHFLTRVKNPNLTEVADVEQQDNEKFAFPQGVGIKRKADSSPDQHKSKKRRIDGSTEDTEQYEDDDIYWQLNFERLDQVFLDQMILDAVSERLDQIVKKLPNIPKLEQQEVHQYLSLLSDEKTGGFITKTDEASGGMYSVNLQKSIEMLCHSACSTIVQERFGSKACRVFRLLLQKKHLEQKQIGELAMIPFKEVKELLYRLFEEKFLKIQEVSKAADYAPSRTFYLFAVDLPQVSRLLVNRCYQAIVNMMVRRESEMEDNKRLLEKNEKIEGILSALSTTSEDTDQVMQELEELITPTEKQQLEKLKIDLARLEQGEIQVEETVFILQNYIRLYRI